MKHQDLVILQRYMNERGLSSLSVYSEAMWSPSSGRRRQRQCDCWESVQKLVVQARVDQQWKLAVLGFDAPRLTIGKSQRLEIHRKIGLLHSMNKP
jgi:hypothetical protein